jgi:hypothetical protein
MPKYFFHYTSKSGFNGIAGTCEPSGTTGQWRREVRTDGEWRPMASQPQPGKWYSGQHTKGFYLTDLSPADLKAREKDLGKLGLGKLQSEEQYMFIFKSEDGQTLAGTGNRGAYSIKQYPNTRKYYLESKNRDTDDIIYLDASCCIWCGPVSKWDSIKNSL